MEPQGISPKNNVQNNWIAALADDRNVDADEAEAIAQAAISSGIGFDDVMFARNLDQQAVLAEATGLTDGGDVYDLSGKDSVASAQKIVGAVRSHTPGITGQIYNALAHKSPGLAKIGRPLINAYGRAVGE